MSAKTFYRGKKVLVTGAGGFIGSALAEKLVECGAKTHVILNNDTSAWRLSDFEKKIKISRGNLSASKATEKILSKIKPEIVFNLASSLITKRDPEMMDEVLKNTIGITRSVINASVKNKVKIFIQMGSIEEYGFGPTPFKESQAEEPFSPYSLGKTMATKYAVTISQLYKMRISIARPAATFGPKQSFGMLTPNLIKAGIEKKDFEMNPGEQLRDFIYIEDVILGLLLIGERGANGEIYNLGSNKKTKVKTFASLLNKIMGNPIKINFGAQQYRLNDFMVYYMDSKKASKKLGWKPEISLKKGLEKTFAWYKKLS